MRELLRAGAEALALAVFLLFIALIAAPTLPFAHSVADRRRAQADCAERQARAPSRAGRDEIAQLIERAP